MSQPPYPGQPYPGEPTSGQPNQGQPSFPGQPPYQGQPPDQGQSPWQPPYPGQPAPEPPPAYPPTSAYQPTSGQPDYAQPQYGAPGYGFPPPQPPKKSKVLPIVLISVAIVLVLCVGGVVALYLVGKNQVDNLDDALDGIASSAPTSAPDTTDVKIAEPVTLGGRKKLTSAQFAGIAEQLKGGLATVPGATNTVGALYGDVATQDIVILAAAEAPIKDPKAELESTFYGAGIGGLKIDNITTAPTGTLGGAAKCGSSETSGINMAICTWADEGSVGMFIWFDESVSKAKTEFPKLRAQVEKKG